jgi:SAM-dependent methyltransferase
MGKMFMKKKKLYPEWYLKYYDEVFKRDCYLSEINEVNAIFPLINKRVLEIGSGKGHHSEEIMKLNPKYLGLVDYQEEAARILKNNFINNSKIEIFDIDAFKLTLKQKVDIALIFFSVLVQVGSHVELENRIKHLLKNTIKPSGVLAFEYIDYDISLTTYPESKKNLLLKKKDFEVFVSSKYSEKTITIEYSGTLNQTPINYKVKLLRLNRSIIDNITNELDLHQFENIGLDINDRRRMAFLRKKQ